MVSCGKELGAAELPGFVAIESQVWNAFVIWDAEVDTGVFSYAEISCCLGARNLYERVKKGQTGIGTSGVRSHIS